MNDIEGGAEKSYPEFMNMVDDFVTHGVISEQAYKHFILAIGQAITITWALYGFHLLKHGAQIPCK